ncbi:AAA family ATPase [uncultured Mucilaginibacter sp.]|uniref:ATP-dependent nuclease n=1 Tax=uncultured Mucilaginibacter sp. TaxID=797541 RepID=UPI0026227D25|nr:AAA family ATPase [uncultured Mucilaginibacter sp.]
MNNNAPRPHITYTSIAEHIKNINETLVDIVDSEVVKFVGEAEAIYDVLDFLIYIIEKEKAGHQYEMVYTEPNANVVRFGISDQAYKGQLPEAQEKLALIIQVREYFEVLKGIQPKVLKKECVYIPVLRSSRNLINSAGNIEGSQIFESTIRQQYFEKEKLQNVIIHTGQASYNKIASAKSGKTEQRKDFAEFEKFIGMNFFQSANVEITPYSGGSHPEITISLPQEMQDVPIHDLGDGVQSIINLFFPIFTAQEGAWVFIDEPELNLHPGFQNLFVRTLLENEFLAKKKLKYFLNSHSNHILSELLLGGTQKSEIFVFHKRNETSSNIKAFRGFETSTLELLGVLNTSNLISNCSVWVEGITDRIYLRAFLTAFLKNRSGFHPIEGLNYAFIEYGGKNLIHYMFEENREVTLPGDSIKAFFINSKIFLLADTDANKEEQHKKFNKLSSKNFIYHQTNVPEIENLLPKNVLLQFLIKELKISNEQAAEILLEPYDDLKLGNYFKKGFNAFKIEKVITSNTGGTLSSYYKSKLAEFVLQSVQNGTITWQMLEV